jgi:hypothetical protein
VHKPLDTQALNSLGRPEAAMSIHALEARHSNVVCLGATHDAVHGAQEWGGVFDYMTNTMMASQPALEGEGVHEP